MPLINFICPDGVEIPVCNCLKEGGCRMIERCATRSYLQLVSRDRPWTGKPSTTQLINGTMLAFLKITKDYSSSPDNRAFMINGTKGHKALEESPDELSLLEQRFDGEQTEETGISDVIETECGASILVDYKVSGSYKVAKALGFYVEDEGTGEFYKTGKRKGEEKVRKILKRSNDKVDREDWEIQLNKYRIEAEKKFSIKISKLKIQCLVRDGNTYIARSRGVFRNIYYFNIKIIPDKAILDYFKMKREALFKALKQGYWNGVCTAKENWDGLRCERYCDVANFCKLGKYLKKDKESEEEMIKGLSSVRRLPRLGKIRLGIKKKTATGVEYPAEINYFKLDPQTPSELENKKLIEEFEKLYGKEPKQIKIMFPLPDPSVFFPQFYKRYGGGVLKCKGDGETAVCISNEHAKGLEIIGEDESGWVRVNCNGQNCPYYTGGNDTSKKKACGEHGALSVLLPELPGAGVWEIVTGSYHSIVNINSGLEYIRAMCGRFHMIPLTLERRDQKIQHDGKTNTHYPLHVSMDFRLSDLQKQALVDPTKMLLELPEPEIDKEDILFQENSVVNASDGIELLSVDMVIQVEDLIKETKTEKTDFLKYINSQKKKEYTSINDIELSDYKYVLMLFEKKKEKLPH